MKSKIYTWITILSTVILASCYPHGAETEEDLDLVYTNYDDGFDFRSQTTYAIPDSVIKITGDVFNDPDGDGKPQFVSATYSTAILNTINQNMQSYGYTRVPKLSNPDLIILVSAMTTTNVYYYYDWWYWGWWYPYWDPWYGWYYGGGYYPYYVSGYRSGSVFIQMINSSSTVIPGENIPVVWSSIFNGLAEGSTASITARIQSGINQAFAQSPYLKH
jgi:Domain of unknown function (DUF4136)